MTYPEWITTESEQRLHDDFRAFLWLILTHLKLQVSPRQLKIALYIQHGDRRRMVQAFRGVGKSWITAAYVLWRLYRDPQERILVVSANENKAIEFATFVRRLIDEVEQLQFLRPKGNGRDSVLSFDVGPAEASQSPSVRATGIFGQITGGRASLIVADDIEVPKNSLTEVMRERLAEAVKEFDAVLTPGGEVIYLGTPQTEQSVYKVIRTRGYTCRIWPARYPTLAQVEKYDGALAPDILEELKANPELVGHSTEPTRFDDLDLAEREASYGKSGFALQFMLDTTLSDSDRYPLKTSDLICMDIDALTAPVSMVWTSDPRSAWADIPNLGITGDRLHRPMHFSETRKAYQGKILQIDPSGRGKDETAWAVLKALEGFVYARSWGGFLSGYDDATLTALANTAKSEEVNLIRIESNFGDGMFSKLLEPHLARVGYPCTIEENHSSTQKELRMIDDLEPVMNQHRLVLDASSARKDVDQEDHRYSLLYQMTHLTKDRNSLRHDDRLDCLAQGVRYFRDQLARDTAQTEAQHQAKLRDAELEEFMRSCGGRVRKHRFQQTNRASRC